MCVVTFSQTLFTPFVEQISTEEWMLRRTDPLRLAIAVLARCRENRRLFISQLVAGKLLSLMQNKDYLHGDFQVSQARMVGCAFSADRHHELSHSHKIRHSSEFDSAISAEDENANANILVRSEVRIPMNVQI